jgi:murein DD-endopeptidase
MPVCRAGWYFCQTVLMSSVSRKPARCRAQAASPPRVLVTALLMALFLSGCSNALRWEDGRGQAANSAPQTTDAARQEVVDTATSMIGIPYRYGGSTPKGFDCSGLVQYSYSAAGMSVPRTSGEQYSAAQPIGLADAEPGDLLFFNFDRRISHVAIYLGNQRFVHAPSSGKLVSIASLDNPLYRQHFAQAGRMR